MPWMEVTVVEERLKFVLKAFKSKENFTEQCRRFGISTKTGYKWLKRFEEGGVEGLKDRPTIAKEVRNKTDDKTHGREEYLGELEAGDRLEAAAGGGKRPDEIRRVLSELSERRKRYGAYAEELERTGETQKSLTDPDSRLMMANGKTDVCYNVQTAVDAENKLIVEFEVTNNASDDNQITPMAAKAKEILEADALTAVLDAGYDSIQDIVAATNLGVDVHVAGTDFDICVPSDELAEAITAHKDGRPVYFAERNIALCPMGKVLYPGFYKKSRGHGVFHNRKACEGCSCKCTREMRGRRYQVPMAESAFSKECDDKGLHARRVRIRPDAAKVGLRKSVAEHPFGTIKRGMDAGYCLTKGLGNVLGEFSLVFLAYNLKRAVNILGVPRLMRAI